jgi:putative Mn2+ efflux pump MntP
VVMTIFVALGLAMDALAVAIVTGASMRRLHAGRMILLAVSFGVFQAAMPVAGWLGGKAISGAVARINYWAAFGLLVTIGVKMVYESFQPKDSHTRSHLAVGVILLLSVAVSIDALAVGIGFAFLGMAIVVPAAVFGLVAFALSLAGVRVGKRLGHLFGPWIEIAGGLILITIGTRILLLHLI